jgi:hypothetical protein
LIHVNSVSRTRSKLEDAHRRDPPTDTQPMLMPQPVNPAFLTVEWIRTHRWRLLAGLAAFVAVGYLLFIELAGPKVQVAKVARRDVV